MTAQHKYQKRHDELLDRIESGELGPGDQLPSQRQLMTLHKVSYTTVTAALSALTRAGHIVSEHGKGTFVRTNPGTQSSGNTGVAGRALNLGLFLPNYLTNPSGVFKGVYTASQELGMHLEFIVFRGEQERRQLCAEMLEGKIPVDGTLLIHLPGYNDVIDACTHAEFPYVIMDAPCRYPCMHQILLDHGKASEEAISHLIDHGHEHIGFITSPLSNEDEEEDWAASKMRGYNQALESHGVSYEDRLVHIMPDHHQESVKTALSDLLKQEDMTGLFVSNGRAALQVIDLLREAGRRVPQDIAVVSFNVNTHEEMGFPEYSLSGVDVPRAPAGEAAVKLIERLITTPGISEAQCVELPLSFMRRRSCGCA